MEKLFQRIELWWEQYNCQHLWEFKGECEGSSENRWYWHNEECAYCDKSRQAMNYDGCACGGDPTRS